MDQSAKPVSPEKAADPSVGKECDAPENLKSKEADSRDDPDKLHNTSNNANGEEKNTNDSEAKLLTEFDIKKEILTDEDGSDFETDDDATDDQRLVIDESRKGKSEKQQTTNQSTDVQKTKGGPSSQQNSAEKENETPVLENRISSPRRKKIGPDKPSSNSATKTSKTARKPIKIKIQRRRRSGGMKLKSMIDYDGGSGGDPNASSTDVPPANVQSTEATTSENSSTPSTSQDLVVKIENNFWHVPFQYGWRREVVFRGTVDPNPRKKPPADVYYFAPCGSKLRSMPEVLNYLKDRNITDLFLSNFTFMKERIYHEPEEVTRQAQSRGAGGFKSPSITPGKSPNIKTPKPKAQKTPKAASPLVVGPKPEEPQTPVVSPVTPSPVPPSPVTPSPMFSGDSVIINTKRWRKRKALPPDFVNTDKALSSRALKDYSPPPQPTLPTPTKILPQPSPPAAPAVVSAPALVPAVTVTQSPPVKKKKLVVPEKKDPKPTPSPISSEEKELPAKRIIKRKIIMSPEETFITPLKKRKVVPLAVHKSPDLTENITASVNSNNASEKTNSASKVVFTFSRMGTGRPTSDNQFAKTGTFTFLRVNPIQNPCTLSCPGLQGQIPDLHCTVCLLLFHSQCVGTTKDFVCQRCQKRGRVQNSKPANAPAAAAPITNGDANHEETSVNVTEETTPATIEKVPEINDNYDKSSGDEQLDEVDLASDDDDENFLTVTPEVVMASPTTPLKESNSPSPSVLTIDKSTLFIPPLPPLVRAPTLPNIAPVNSTVFPRLPRLGKPPALMRPVIPLAPPFGAASSQLRTLVSQIPATQIVSQPLSTQITTAIPTILPFSGANVTQILAPIVTSPTMPVNILQNSAPIVVGTQVLTPVSISMPGIARGTVIYTNNPTLRFLLPSSEGLQTFIPSKPVAASPPNDCSVTSTTDSSAVTTTTTSTMSKPISSTGETKITVSSKFLVQKPAMVVNMRGKSFCELVLQVGKAEKGQVVKFVDSEEEVPSEEVLPPVEDAEVQEQNVDVKNTNDSDGNKESPADGKESLSDVGLGLSVDASKEPEAGKLKEPVDDVNKNTDAQELVGSVSDASKESDTDKMKEPVGNANESCDGQGLIGNLSVESVGTGNAEVVDNSSESVGISNAENVDTSNKEPSAETSNKDHGESNVKPAEDGSSQIEISDSREAEADVTKELSGGESSNNKSVTHDEKGTESVEGEQVSESIETGSKETISEVTKESQEDKLISTGEQSEKTTVTDKVNDEKMENGDVSGDVEMKDVSGDVEMDQDEIDEKKDAVQNKVDTNSETAKSETETKDGGYALETLLLVPPACQDGEKGLSEEPEVMEEERPFSPLFTEEELRDWDKDSVSSNDDEEEYRPTSPIILCAQEFQDGYTRIRSTALTNRGAQLACPSGSCARVSCYKRPVTDLYADQEHAYSTPRGRQLFKQAGRKSMMTLKPPRRPFQQLLSACDALSNVFDYLSTADLLRASTVCRTWRKLASQPHQWATVKLKGLKVKNWKTCAKNLEYYGTTMLDMHGFDQEDNGWHQFLAHIHHLRKLQGLVFGRVPAWVLQAVAISLPQLLCLEAEYIEPPTSTSEARNNGKNKTTQIDVGWWASLLHLTVLRIRASHGMVCAPFSPCGTFKALSNLTSLTHLSLTSLRTFSSSDGLFLENLLHLQVLELGQCKDWRDQAFQRLGKLRSLRRLRLEVGGSQGDRGLANALSHMNRLEELTLLSFKITTSLAASIRRLRHLWHLTIWPDMNTEGAMVVYNTLQAVRSLKKLQSFSWGIIFTESKSTRYSRKSTKYREAVDVDEWWSAELRKGHRAKSIKIPLLKAFSDEAPAPASNKGGTSSPSNSMEQGLIGVGHLKHKLSKCLPDVEIYVYQVPETLLAKVYGTTR